MEHWHHTPEQRTNSQSTTTAATFTGSFNPGGVTSGTSLLLQGVGGFLNDFQTLSVEIQCLKHSNKLLNEKLKQKQIELDAVSDEWCTSQALLAKNESILKSQNIQMASLNHEAKAIQNRTDVWDSKLNQVSEGLETMFQKATKMAREDDQADQAEETGAMWNAGGHSGSSNSQSQLQVANLQMTSSFRVGDTASCKQLEMLREKLLKRMQAKCQSQEEMKDDLARKNHLLKNLSRLVARKRTLPALTYHETVPEVNGESNHQISRRRNSVEDQHFPSSSDASTSTLTEEECQEKEHTRDNTIPIKDGYGCTCGERFDFIAPLHRHLGSTNDESKKFTCTICKVSFLFFSALSRHYRENHEHNFPPNTHGCRTCGAVFPNKTELMKGWRHRNGNCLRTKKSLKRSPIINLN